MSKWISMPWEQRVNDAIAERKAVQERLDWLLAYLRDRLRDREAFDSAAADALAAYEKRFGT